MTNNGARPTRFDMIANQMMKGIKGATMQGNLAGTKEEIETFKQLYGETISYIEEMVPKSSKVSVGVCGALGKAVLWYGKGKIAPFVKAVANREFNGRTDPCHILWEWMIRYNKRNSTEVYRRTVTAIRAFVREGEINWHLKPALDDIFEWDDNYCIMYQPRKNQHTQKKTKLKKVKKVINQVENQNESDSLSNSSK